MMGASQTRTPMLSMYWRLVLRPHMKRLVLLVALAVIAAIAEVASLGLIIPILTVAGTRGSKGNIISRTAEEWLAAAGAEPTSELVLVTLLVTLAVLVVIRNVLVLLTGYIVEKTGARVFSHFTELLFRAHLGAEYDHLASKRPGAMLELTLVSAKDVANFLVQTGTAFAATLELAFVAAFLLWVSWWMFAVVFVFAIIVRFTLRAFIQKPSLARTHDKLQADHDVASTVVEGLEAAKVVKAYNLIDRLLQQLRIRQSKQLRHRVFFGMMARLQMSLTEAIAAIVLAFVVGLSLLLPGTTADFAAITVFAATLLRELPAAHRLNTLFSSAARDFGSIAAVDQALHHLQKEPEHGTATVPPRLDVIRFSSVSFAYRSRFETQVLNNFTATLERGTMVALTGPTGAGKTTAADLLMRLYAPTAGTITANGISIASFPLRSWRSRIGYVPQEAFLFNATIRDNIARFDPSVPIADVERAARLARIDDFVATLPLGYDTLVGERGTQLSGGQRQRLAIARALVSRPEVLIFDEATSALDTATERAVQEAINDVKTHGIVLLIAHRLTTVREADQIIVLQHGRIVEQGSYDSLMAARGEFWRLQEVGNVPQRQQELQEATSDRDRLVPAEGGAEPGGADDQHG